MIFSIVQFLHYVFRIIFIHKQKSTFAQNFIDNILKDEKNTVDNRIHDLLTYYKSIGSTVLNKEDLGAGSITNNDIKTTTVNRLLNGVSISKKYGKLLNRISEYFNTKKCIELGTSLGISTAYLSTKLNTIISIEGSKDIADLSHKTLLKFNFDNIKIINANFNDVFEDILKEQKDIDLIFIDGNHTKEATLNYFNIALKYVNSNTIIIFDDIYWKIGMKNAWLTIKDSNKVRLSLDLFKFGIIFFDNKTSVKEEHTLWY